MPVPIDQIDYTTLSAPERLVLAQDIIDSVIAENQGEPLTDDQLDLLERRAAAIDSGRSHCVPWAQARAEIFGPA